MLIIIILLSYLIYLFVPCFNYSLVFNKIAIIIIQKNPLWIFYRRKAVWIFQQAYKPVKRYDFKISHLFSIFLILREQLYTVYIISPLHIFSFILLICLKISHFIFREYNYSLILFYGQKYLKFWQIILKKEKSETHFFFFLLFILFLLFYTKAP